MAFLVRVSFKDPFLHNYAMSSFPFTHCSSSQLLETFENQLSTLRKDLENKDKMLVMYENSMADLSTTLHTLKRSLEEKVRIYFLCFSFSPTVCYCSLLGTVVLSAVPCCLLPGCSY